MWQLPLLAFFFVSYLLATMLFASWAIYWGGFPQFSQVGLSLEDAASSDF